MGIVVSNSRVVATSVDKVFAYMDDYRNVPRWLFGITRFEPVGEQESGLGAVFDGAISLGVTLKARVKCTGWERDRLIELESIKGFTSSSRWVFEEEDGGTRVTGSVTYELPFGPAGASIGRVIEPLVKVAVTRTTETLEAQLRDLEPTR